ncbi:MAG TPA: MaoC family dehydratase N-terminal domain-containing protein [Caldimonas sp.]|jgi:acyl dehydratase|nr:MaoC family dehydratase N-terminal domain-containing protein [Caldimonas sp.]
MIDRGRIGFRTAATIVRVEGWRVKLFCAAIGETDPVYLDDAAARAAGHRACLLPPTFLKAIDGEHFSSAAMLDVLAMPVGGVLHAEQTFHHVGPVYVGDEVEVSRTIVDIFEKKNGAMCFVVIQSDYRVAARAVASSRQTILIRQAAAA